MNLTKPDPQVADALRALLPKSRRNVSFGDREYLVLALVAQGHDTIEIAKRMDVSPKTTDNQRQSLYKKLRVKNAVQAARLFWAAQWSIKRALPVEKRA